MGLADEDEETMLQVMGRSPPGATLLRESPTGASTGGSEVTTLDQGVFETCTIYAITSAMMIELNRKYQMQIEAEGVVNTLLAHVNTTKAVFPKRFHCWSGHLKLTNGKFALATILVVDSTVKSIESAERGDIECVESAERCDIPARIISYDTSVLQEGGEGVVYEGTEHPRHCVYLQKFDVEKRVWVGINSWGSSFKKPEIPLKLSKENFYKIYDIVVVNLEELLGNNESDVRVRTNELIIIKCKNGDHSLVRGMLEARADVNASNIHGRTPLHHAVKNEHAAVVKVLLAARATPNMKDKFGKTPLHLAVQAWQTASSTSRSSRGQMRDPRVETK